MCPIQKKMIATEARKKTRPHDLVLRFLGVLSCRLPLPPACAAARPALPGALGWPTRCALRPARPTSPDQTRPACSRPSLPPLLPQLLTAAEAAWVDGYHAQVWQAISPRLAGDELEWLRQATLPLGA
jgi:hypothetical protein